jgi:Dolichyl-phosphate-mannose-protein mannosyltransferase
VTGGLLGILVLALLGATGLLIALILPGRGIAQRALAAYVVAAAEAVALSFFLSAFDAMTRGTLIAGAILLFLAALASWQLAWAPHPVSLRASFVHVSPSAPGLVLGAIVAVALAYVFALILGTPPNGWDPLNYHLARAAFWVQAHHIGYIRDAYDQRLNFNPPNAEVGIAFLMGVTRDERAAGLVQFLAALSCAVGVFALARRAHLSRAQAAWGALLFVLLPIVLLQSTDAKNDVVVASFLVAAAVFILDDTTASLALAGVATALAVGAKFTAAYGLVLLAALALLAPTRRLWPLRILTIAAGALIGSYWYLVNYHETGHLLGDQSGTGKLTAPFDPAANVVTAYGDALDTLDLSGAQGKFILLFVVAGLAVAAATIRHGKRLAVAAGAVVMSPLVILVLSEHVGRPGLLHLYDLVGKPPGYLAVGDGVSSSPTTASDTASWFGPLGLLLVTTTAVATAYRVRHGRTHRWTLVLALAPFAWLVLAALTLTYHPWQGRFFIFPVALSAALWGGLLVNRAAAWTAVALVCTTALLSLAHYVEKPVGLGSPVSVWKMPRWELQSSHDPPLGPLLRFVEENLPAHASVGLALGTNGFGFPFFGPHLSRRLVLVPTNSSGRETETGWLVADAQRTSQIDGTCWRVLFHSDRGAVFRRTAECSA